jgi:predicted transcriptional regulator
VKWWLKDRTFKSFVKWLIEIQLLSSNISSIEKENIKNNIEDNYRVWLQDKEQLQIQAEQIPPEEQQKIDTEYDILIQSPHEYVSKLLDELIVGEQEIKHFVFYSFLTAFNKNIKYRSDVRPQGESSSGKTHIVVNTLSLFPEHMKCFIGGTTPKAWLYGAINSGILNLNHKIFGFLVEPPNQFYDLINSILSGDNEEFEWHFTSKDDTGRLSTEKIIVKGVPVYVTCSVKKPQYELGTRITALSPDTSSEQTDKIIDSEFNSQFSDKSSIKYKKEAVKGYIENVEIFLNTIEKIIDPLALIYKKVLPSTVRARRDFKKLVALAQSYELFNSLKYVGILNCEKRVLFVQPLSLSILKYCRSALNFYFFELTPNLLRFYNELKSDESRVLSSFNNSIDINLVAERLNKSSVTVKFYLSQLASRGFLEKQTIGRENIYFFGSNRQVEFKVLPVLDDGILTKIDEKIRNFAEGLERVEVYK